ncbi:MAG TPA: helix-turn-helix transcriptional regulator [Steroidobacteraceae bacterium]|jgi:predicted XRE-type DNA-binding protein
MRAASHKPASYQHGTSNVYADLGYRAPETVLVKAQLVRRIAELLAERGMTQTEAATALDISQPKLLKMLCGEFRGLSLYKLMVCLTHLGQDVHIIISPRSDQRSTGTLSVTFV